MRNGLRRGLTSGRDAAQRDKARRLEEAAVIAKQNVVDELWARKEAGRCRREHEQRAQEKLRQRDICVAGYQWNRSKTYTIFTSEHEL